MLKRKKTLWRYHKITTLITYGVVQNIWNIHTFLETSELTYRSGVLCGWYQVAPAVRTAAESARHLPQHVEWPRY
jgi:hypothetical protein